MLLLRAIWLSEAHYVSLTVYAAIVYLSFDEVHVWFIAAKPECPTRKNYCALTRACLSHYIS